MRLRHLKEITFASVVAKVAEERFFYFEEEASRFSSSALRFFLSPLFVKCIERTLSIRQSFAAKFTDSVKWTFNEADKDRSWPNGDYPYIQYCIFPLIS